MGSMPRCFMFLVIATCVMVLFQNCSDVAFQSPPANSSSLNGSPPMCLDVATQAVKPKLKWDWFTELQAFNGEKFLTFNQLMASPMVADLDGDKTPEVAFVTFSTTAADRFSDSVGPTYRANGVLRVVEGPTGRTLFSIGDPDLAPWASQSPLLMDIDGDGKVEIFYIHYLGTFLISLNFDGTFRWKLPISAPQFSYAGLSGADLDGDGIGEVIAPAQLISEDASRNPIVKAILPGLAKAYTTLAMPLDPGQPNVWSIVKPNAIYDASGKIVAQLPAGILFLAAADISPLSPGIEIIATAQNFLYIVNGLTGDILRSVDLTAFNDLICPGKTVVGGGAPSIGDFDGNPADLEIAVATGRHLTIFDSDANPKFKTVTQDCSSLTTGLTSFDLNGDRKPEILYADEEYFRIFEVRNGVLEVVQKIVNPSGTLHEYPVVADLTGRGGSNILLASNNYAVSSFYKDIDEVSDKNTALGITGLRAFESAESNAWMPARPVWNQYSFHPDLITDTGSFLIGPQIDYGLFRRNTQGSFAPVCAVSIL